MPRKKSIPQYRYHVSGQARVTFCNKDFLIGTYNSAESHSRYQALLQEYLANGKTAPPGETRLADKPLTVACITAAYRRELPNKFPNCKDQLRHGERLCDLLEAEHAHLNSETGFNVVRRGPLDSDVMRAKRLTLRLDD